MGRRSRICDADRKEGIPWSWTWDRKERTVERAEPPAEQPASNPQRTEHQAANRSRPWEQQRIAMPTQRKPPGGDAFARALRGCFGEQTSRAKIEEARRLYARYRTEDVLEHLQGMVGGKKNESDKP